jgi:hypothetical protein
MLQSGHYAPVASFMYDRMGAAHHDVNDEAIDRILAELDGPLDDEHPDVSIVHETGWGLSAFQSGLLIWENVEDDDEPRHMRPVPRAVVRDLFRLVAAGDLDALEAEPWQPGYG